ncbi:MAG TPA: alpha-amylase family glycosyl hydrolase, partial [Isosphaeraceae bacterium]|nr:alpha-amylase family glycosyl hydrolase [Isosphaeraceae bacterium]
IEDDDFWREFRNRVKGSNPDAYIVGEVWVDSRHWLQGDMWDAVLNYIFTRACIAFFIGDEVDEEELKRTVLHPAGTAGAESFAQAIEVLRSLYHPNVSAVMINLLDSHDMTRFVTLAGGDRSALRLATLFQMTYPGAPSIYYGDEIGMEGRHDPDNRRAFPWDESRWDRALLHDFQKMIALRHQHKALRRGAYESLLAQKNVHVHQCSLDEDRVIVALNAGTGTGRVDVPVPGLPEGSVLEEAWTRQVVRVERGQIHGLELAPRSGRVLIRLQEER